ncbi:MAG: cupin domain-containing protein [Verrucomicrobiota bacterium]
MGSFHSFENLTGLLQRAGGDRYPSTVHAWSDEDPLLCNSGTSFGFVQRGDTTVTATNGRYPLKPGMYFSVPGKTTVEGGSGIVIIRHGFHGFFHIGGPAEKTGRLRYIDGCTDSLLIPPVLLGDPCLNLLHIPPHTHQTQHTHPSFRAGIIVSGTGECVTPETSHTLFAGLSFVIEENGRHSFHTGGEPLRVIAFHPDSDFGPTHETHPMINRTYIES